AASANKQCRCVGNDIIRIVPQRPEINRRLSGITVAGAIEMEIHERRIEHDLAAATAIADRAVYLDVISPEEMNGVTVEVNIAVVKHQLTIIGLDVGILGVKCDVDIKINAVEAIVYDRSE